MKDYTPQDIYTLYQKHVMLPRSYFEKYKKLPMNLEDPNWKWDNHDFARIPCLLDFREWITKYSIDKVDKLLYTSDEDPEIPYITAGKKTLFEYDMNTHGNDLHTLDLPDKDYDLIIFSQTLEHLHDPSRCLANIMDHLKPGGYVFTSVPIVNIPHMTPIHFGSVTQIGLVTMLDRAGLTVKELGQWGNRSYINFIFEKHWWPDYRNLIDRHGVIENEPQNACQTWALARKE
tara:strand:- start:154397 stop:155092 length:696 start_codon:yes stop_codon:yes gene_type:complete